MTDTTRDLAAVAAWLNEYSPASAWFASSGERLTGTVVATHLEATARILTEDGWANSNLTPGLSIDQAMAAAELGGDGSGDTRYVATTLMEAVICSATGALAAHYLPWEKAGDRTTEQVVRLLIDTATFARQYGPEAAR